MDSSLYLSQLPQGFESQRLPAFVALHPTTSLMIAVTLFGAIGVVTLATWRGPASSRRAAYPLAAPPFTTFSSPAAPFCFLLCTPLSILHLHHPFSPLLPYSLASLLTSRCAIRGG